jgi:hypothetical protein
MRTRYDLLKEGKPLTFQVPECNTPCTAELEVRLKELAKYFDTRAKENHRYKANHGYDHSGYYFAGKASSYEHAAVKIREVLDTNATYLKDEPQVWITEYCGRHQLGTVDEWWCRSGDIEVCGEFSSELAALKAIAQHQESGDSPNDSFLVRRARRIA